MGRDKSRNKASGICTHMSIITCRGIDRGTARVAGMHTNMALVLSTRHRLGIVK